MQNVQYILTLSGDAGESKHGGDAVGAQGVRCGLHARQILYREGHLAVRTEQLRQGSASGFEDVLGANIHLKRVETKNGNIRWTTSKTCIRSGQLIQHDASFNATPAFIESKNVPW